MRRRKTVAIIGGSATAIAAFIKLVRTAAASRIDIIDPKGMADSIAFTTSQDELLCNTSVQTMSLLDDDIHDLQQEPT